MIDLDNIISAQSECLNAASKTVAEKMRPRGSMRIFEWMKAAGMPLPKEREIPGHHIAILRPSKKYEYDYTKPLLAQGEWMYEYRKLVLLIMNAEAINLESIIGNICPDFLSHGDNQWAKALVDCTLDWFDEDNVSEYDKFLVVFKKPFRMLCSKLGYKVPVDPLGRNSGIVYTTADPEELATIQEEFRDKYTEECNRMLSRIREYYRREYERFAFMHELPMTENSALLRVSNTWMNPYPSEQNE